MGATATTLSLRSRSVATEGLSTDHLIRRIRWNRAVKRGHTPASPLWQAADARERVLIAVLQRRFGLTTITQDGLDWLILGQRSSDRIA